MVEEKEISQVESTDSPPEEMPKGVVFAANCENKEQAGHVISRVREYCDENGIKTPLVLLGQVKTDETVLGFAELVLQLFRQYELEKNERELVLTHEDQLLAMQLCLAENNKEKFGDFDVEASKVLEMNNRLINEKLLGKEAENASEEYKEIKAQYGSYLNESNNIDMAEVYMRLKNEFPNNEALEKQLRQTSYLMLNRPFGKIEDQMANFLVEDKTVYKIQIECSLDQSISEACPNAPPPSVVIEVSSWEDVHENCGQNSSQIYSPGARKSVTELYVEKILYGYLHLLVNSRSELALARVINVPERELDHKAFTEIKRYAKDKKMPMYQSITSFIMRIRLVRDFRPDSHPLCHHVKGLSEFIDLLHKLMDIIEENPDPRLAVKKVLNVVKNTVLKSKDNLLRRESVMAATDRILQRAENIFNAMDQNPQPSPSRSSSNGGSLVGRQALRVLRSFVDHYSSQPPFSKNMDVLTDNFSSQRTPLRFPSVMSQFRSPLEHSPEAKESKSLAERMKDKVKPDKKKLGAVPRYQSTMDWAAPVHDVGLSKEEPLVIEDFIPSKTIAHPAAPRPKIFNSKVLASLGDQENADSTLNNGKKNCNIDKPVLSSQNSNVSRTSKPSTKRALSDALSSQPAKKAKKMPAKKKNMPLQKGQKQMTSFFRI